MKLTKSHLREVVNSVIREETEYQAYFKKMLDKYGKDSPADMSDEEKKEFFNAVDKGWKAKDESVNESVSKFDDVRIKSTNQMGMVYAIQGKKVVVKTAKGLVKTTVDDLEVMANESVVNEVKFYAFWNNKKHEIEADSLWAAKQKAITQLKVPKSKQGLLAIVNASEHERGSFQFESVNESSTEMKKLEDAIKIFQDKIKAQGRITNARDEEHLERLLKLYKDMGGKGIKESKVNDDDCGCGKKMNESKLDSTSVRKFKDTFIKKYTRKSINGWQFYYDVEMDAFYWSNPKRENEIWATPYWDNKPMIPVDVTNEEGETTLETTIKLPYTGDFKKDEAVYLRAMGNLFKTVK